MRIGSKSLERTFSFSVEGIEPLPSLVSQLLDRMEKQELLVYDPKDIDAFSPEADEAGNLVIHSRARLPIQIGDWLCAACQMIRFEGGIDRRREGRSPNALAWYSSNAAEVLCPPESEHHPLGPAAHVGEIVLTSQVQTLLISQDANRLCFILAHELVHVFDAMRLIVPAFIDWNGFWTNALQMGNASGAAREVAQFHTLSLDDYGTENELAMIQEYWPSLAEDWFRAFYSE